MKMNLYELLEKVSSSNIQFEPKTVFYGEYWISSMSYKEWEETFYLNAKNGDALEFFKCTDGCVMNVELKTN